MRLTALFPTHYIRAIFLVIPLYQQLKIRRMDMDMYARSHGGLSALRRTQAGRTVASATGGLRTTALVRAFVKDPLP